MRAVALAAAALALGLGACSDDDDSVAAPPADRPATAQVTASATPSASPSGSSSASSSGSSSGSAAAEGVTIEIDLVDGRPVERPDANIEVAEGETVTLVMTADTAEEIHVHGYDEYLNLTPGQTDEVSFTADLTGSWLVEVHESGLSLFNLQVS